MKRHFKAAISALLAAALLAGGFPPPPALANTQKAVDLGEAKLSVEPGAGNALELSWLLPTALNTTDSAGTPYTPQQSSGYSNSPDDRASHYDISYRNMTKGETYKTIAGLQDPAAGGAVIKSNGGDGRSYTLNPTPPLEKASIYLMKVEPYHEHRTPDSNGNWNARARSTLATSPPTGEVAFLTDLTVTATGMGNSLTVTWSNPSPPVGADPFIGYNIYFRKDTSGASTAWPDSIQVLTNDPKLQKVGANYVYTLESSKIDQAGVYYQVKVEPLVIVNGKPAEARDSSVGGGKLPIIYMDGNKPYTLNFTSNEYRYDSAYIQIGLTARSIGDMVRLTWGVVADAANIEKLVIRSADNPAKLTTPTGGDLVSEMYGLTAAQAQFETTYKPKDVTYYVVWFYYRGRPEPVATLIAVYDPSYTKYTPTKPRILSITDDSADSPSNISLTITWEAFYHKFYNALDTSEPGDSNTGYTVDRNIEYDVWITDDLTFLETSVVQAKPTASGLDARMLVLGKTKTASGDVYSFEHAFDKYVTIENGQAVEKSVVGNKIYYVKIVARRVDGERQVSEPAYGSHFVPPTEDLDVKPNMLARLPLRIKVVDGVEQITENSITVQWDRRWYEAYDAATGSWYSTVGVKGGQLVFGKDIDNATTVIKLNDPNYMASPDPGKAIRDALTALGAAGVNELTLPVRLMNLKDEGYDIHVVEYDVMEAAGGYDAYVKSILDDAGKWQYFKPADDAEHPEWTAAGLKPNTAYAIIVRPVTKQKAWWPAVVIGTTLMHRDDLEVMPTVPIIQGVSTTATSVTVRIEYSNSLEYELRWSELLTDHSEGGETIDSATLKGKGELKVDADGKQWLYYTIEDLFPDTNHYVWVRAYSGQNYSAWSNAIMLRTKDLDPPKPPEGLGLISTAHLEVLNKTNGGSLLQSDYTYMILEWLRDIHDMTSEQQEGEGPAKTLYDENIKGFIMAQFENLLGNRAYYIRAKTILTVTKGSPGLERSYQYVIELSVNEDFTDAIRFTVPADGDKGEKFITKESAWTQTIKLFTGTSKGEYDGDKNPDLYPLPQDDYEIVYDPKTDTLTYRFRTNKTDSAGKADQGVDQRFISKLIANKTYNYGIDLSTYNGKDLTGRVVELPYSILKAFEERKITLSIISGDQTFSFPPGFAKTAETNALKGFGAGGALRFSFTKQTSVPALGDGEGYAVSRQKAQLTAIGASSLAMGYTALPYTVAQKLNSRATVIDQNVGSYAAQDGAWLRQKETYNRQAGTLSFTTTRPGTFTAIVRATPPAAQGAENEAAASALLNISSAINVKDLAAFNPSANIPANDLDKLIYAVSKNAKEVYVKASLTDTERDTLYKAGMLATGGASVTREEGIAALVRLYEVKTKRAVTSSATVAGSAYKDIAGSAEKYRTPLLKAADLGFFTGSSANPKGALSYGDAVLIIEMIMADAGMI